MKTATPRRRGKTTIASVTKALAILDLVATEGPELSATEISRSTGLRYATAHHLIATLVDSGYLQQNPATRRYRLGLSCLTVGTAARSSMSIVDVAQPVIESLARQVNEHVNLAVLDGDSTVYVSQVASSRVVAIFTRLGTRVPLYCTGVGKAMLAYMDAEEAEQAAASGDYRPFTANTATSWLELSHDLAAIREIGYAVDREEREEGVVCVAAPVMDANGKPLGAVSVSGPSTRIISRLESLGSAVRTAAQNISAGIGNQPTGT